MDNPFLVSISKSVKVDSLKKKNTKMVNKWLTLDKIVFYIVGLAVTATAITCLTIALTVDARSDGVTTTTKIPPVTIPPVISDPVPKNG